ncbi:hypothetical protein Glove_680g81 [Diversispora epigaea]|uniref:Protein kinase domain-containing protein n=1 Tax=Diversispora epigaea TaxID=1348612 RepID=A0A397G8Y6_9GLOM|nr:hypothetical protein Glove_680g81 [Diversispora epigaea]
MTKLSLQSDAWFIKLSIFISSSRYIDYQFVSSNCSFPEFLRNNPVIFTEPTDKSLLYLSQSKDFINLLQHICKDNNLRSCVETKHLVLLKMEYFCPECHKPCIDNEWCKDCNSKRLREEFKNWASGNSSIDELIQNTQLAAEASNQKLEWIPYNEFTEVGFLSKGGFGTVYKAFWKNGYINTFDIKEGTWKRMPNEYVVLKSLNDSKDITLGFFDEISRQLKSAATGACVIPIYGVTQHPDTEDYMMVMAYSNKGSLRNYLNENYYELDLETKIYLTYQIAASLSEIHKLGFVHCDFHSGNVVLYEYSGTLAAALITDFGLCKSIHQVSEKTIEGVIPYIAPEVFMGRKYSQASDIYSFGIMMNEIATGLPPHHNISHDSKLSLRIVYQYLRPEINTEITPRLFIQLIEKCWEKDPKNRPTASEIHDILLNYFKKKITDREEIWNQVNEIEKNTKNKTGSFEYNIHERAFYTSRTVEILDGDLDFDDENIHDDELDELDF